MAANHIEGGCFCGAVRYCATQAPLGSMICHCRTCRRVAGSPVVAWLTFAGSEFAFTHGVPAELQSSKGVRRRFCAACGTPLTYENETSPGEIDVTTCTLHDPEAFPPTHHSWMKHDLTWVRFGDELPGFPQSRADG
ncbi:MAG: GFA family protein [Sinimarinibacterium sp.]|jgi:hypothetical protein